MPEPTTAARKEPDDLFLIRAALGHPLLPAYEEALDRIEAKIERLRRIEEAARAAWADDSKFYLLVAALRKAEELAVALNSSVAKEPTDA